MVASVVSDFLIFLTMVSLKGFLLLLASQAKATTAVVVAIWLAEAPA